MANTGVVNNLSPKDDEKLPPSAATHRGAKKYDLFISYSHFYDRDLVRDVEKTLWSFGRRWYQLRGVRTYRDENNLAAEPKLWAAIEEAIRVSACMALCASPGSAQSPWVPKELEAFVKERGIDGLCVVQTNGVLPWTDNLSAEEMLRREDSAMSESGWKLLTDSGVEPLVVDLRPFRSMPERKRRKDPEYLSRVAAIAAKALGVEKETIWGYYHRAERIRTAFLVAISLVLLALALALGVAFRTAERQMQIARTQTAEANTQRGIAEHARTLADQQRKEAIHQATVALSRQLAAESQTLRSQGLDLQVPTLLASEAIERSFQIDSDRAMRDATRLLPRQLWLVKHGAQLWKVIFSNDGRYVATASGDNTARFLEGRSGRQILKLIHQGPVRDLGFSTNGRYLATASEDKTARVFELPSGTEVLHLTHEGPVVNLSFTADGRYLATSSVDENAKTSEERVFDVASKKEVAHFNGVVDAAMAFSPDGRYIAIGGSDKTVRLYDVANKTKLWDVTSDDSVGELTFSSDGQYLAMESQQCHDTRIFQTTKGNQLWRHAGDFSEYCAHVLRFSLDARYLAAPTSDSPNTVVIYRIYNGANGKEVSRLVHQGPVCALAFRGDGRYVATGSNDETARVFETVTGKEVSRLAEQDAVCTVAMSMDGRYVAAGGWDNSARVFESGNGGESLRIPWTGSNTSLAFTVDGRHLMARGWAGNIARLFEVGSGNQVFSIDLPWHVDNTTRPINDSPFEASPGRRLEITHGEWHRAIDSLAFSADRRYVAFGSLILNNKGAAVYETASGREVSRLVQPGDVNSLAFSPDGHYIASGSDDNSVRIFEVMNGREVSRITYHNWVNTVAFSSDSRYLVSGSEDESACVIEVPSGKEIFKTTHQGAILFVAFSPDDHFVAIGSANATGPPGNYNAKVFEFPSGKQVSSFKQPGEITALAFSADGRYLATGSKDATAHIFKADSGEEMSTMTLDEPIEAITFAIHDSLLVTASVNDARGMIVLTRHKLLPKDLVEYACSHVTRNLSMDEWEQYVGREFPYQNTCPNVP